MSGQVAKAWRAHQGAPRVLLGQGSAWHTPGPSIQQDTPAVPALCAVFPVPLWISQGSPQTTHSGSALCTPQGFSRGPEEAAGRPQTPQWPSCRAPLPRSLSLQHRAPHNPPKVAHGPEEHMKNSTCHDRRWAMHLPEVRPGAPLPQSPRRAPTTHSGTAVSPSHRRLGGVWGLSTVWVAVRPDNQRERPSCAGGVRMHRQGDPRLWHKPRPNPTPDFSPAVRIWTLSCAIWSVAVGQDLVSRASIL